MYLCNCLQCDVLLQYKRLNKVLLRCGHWFCSRYHSKSFIANIELTHKLYQKMKKGNQPKIQWNEIWIKSKRGESNSINSCGIRIEASVRVSSVECRVLLVDLFLGCCSLNKLWRTLSSKTHLERIPFYTLTRYSFIFQF